MHVINIGFGIYCYPEWDLTCREAQLMAGRGERASKTID